MLSLLWVGVSGVCLLCCVGGFLVRFWVYWLQVWCVGFIVLGFHGCFVLGVVVTLVLLGAL